ncbi:MAG: prenyltransferase [Candidatus Bathyarchaeota archaeon]|nr:prenyltransferase [Candidatus Bathyarchaeota archaeon]
MKTPDILRVVRLHIVAGGVLAFSLGALLALAGGGRFELWHFVLGYVVVFLGDLSSHYSNDYFDVDVDRYVEQKKFFSGSNILVTHHSLRPAARLISLGLLLSSNVLAAGLVLFLGFPVLFLLVILTASLVGWFYSAPPLRLISKGLGEAAVAWVTGFAIPGLGYLSLRGQLDPLFIYFAVPFMLYGFMLSLSLQAPDAAVDQKTNKKTLIVRKGTQTSFTLILAATTTATCAFILYSYQLPSLGVNFAASALFSLAPLTAALIGFAGILQNRNAHLFSSLNVASLFIFNALLIAYLITTI